ncbi:hypothetical protein BUALT_Bualt06G0088100 [Buddleja alternifolia]|uniref:Uncharacterized protein n=1 Tax=Buddleja alternifolia TaxID=168488 RepID=A0AAV6XF91_9LAMI|nr:hypothetical protein BUALT_Bualt06G0088100 [Buddleja alternifolia]
MADGYWRHGGVRQQPATALPPQAAKRPRSDYEMQSGQHVTRDTDSVNAAYDRYLRSVSGATHQQISSYGGEPGRPMSSGLAVHHHHLDDPRIIAMGGSDPSMTAKGRSMGVGGHPEISLPPDASSTLFFADIFRPFVGYKEVRLVTKESRHPGGDPLVLCFVDFQSPAHAATTMDAIQDIASLDCIYLIVEWEHNLILVDFSWKRLYGREVILLVSSLLLPRVQVEAAFVFSQKGLKNMVSLSASLS